MKKVVKVTLITIGSILCVLIAAIVLLSIFGHGKLMLPVKKKEAFELEDKYKYEEALSVKDNKIVNESGEQVVLKGVMVPELQKLNIEGRFNEKYFEEVFHCGGNAVRIPVHPDKWVNDEYYLWRNLDKVVTWAVKNNKYVIIDLHFTGNIKTGEGKEMIDVGMNQYDFSIKFWNTVASYFKGVPNVIFEVFNEPASIRQDIWRTCAGSLVNTIRETGSKQLVLVSGIDYSYDISCWEKEPMKDDNIAYTAHIYPNRTGWENKYQSVCDKLPIVVTEWGYISKEEPSKQKYLVGSSESFGKPLIDFIDKHNIGWIACWYDDGWEPPMFHDGMDKKTDWGEFVMKQLK